MNVVNLARRPFENLRPVRRLSALMWVVGGLLMFANLWLYWGHLTGFSATRGQLADVRELIDGEAEKLDQVEADVAALALDSQNQTVSDLNQLIEKRVFPWSLLFDRLEGILPHEARLLGVRPEGQEIKIAKRQQSTRSASTRRRGRQPSRARAEEPTGIVEVGLNGVARTDEAVLELIDALWNDPTFDKPSLKGERRNQTNEIDFSLNVEFLIKEAASLADLDQAVDPDVSVIASADTQDVRDAAPPYESEPSAAPTPGSGLPATAALPQVSARRDDGQADDVATARPPVQDPEAPARTVSRTGRPTTRSVPSSRPRTSSRTSSRRSDTGTSRAGRSATAPAPHTAPQVPGVVVLPGARSVPQTAPTSASPTAPDAPAPSRQPTERATRPTRQPRINQATDPDTPVPPSQNASAGASLGGGAP